MLIEQNLNLVLQIYLAERFYLYHNYGFIRTSFTLKEPETLSTVVCSIQLE